MLNCFTTTADRSIPIFALLETELNDWLSNQPKRIQAWLHNIQYKAKAGSIVYLSGPEGQVEAVLLGMGQNKDFWQFGQLAASLPAGCYHLDPTLSSEDYYLAALTWGLGAYQFTAYKKPTAYEAKLFLDEKRLSTHLKKLEAVLTSTYLIRDLINTPAEDMGPGELAEVASTVAEEFGATINQIVGEELLTADYPLIYAVGKGSAHAPRLIDMTWGDPHHPKLTLVGKGVCFDSGGLDIKPAGGMDLMKKDMAGAAHAIGLGRIIMMLNLPVRLRLLIPAVENAVGCDAFRPRDVFVSRKGMTVEITNTDAEGRLVLADALTEAVVDKPDWIFDFSTLTGAARVALGTDISALFTNNEELSSSLQNLGEIQLDPVWRLPLYQPYRSSLDSYIADITNSGTRAIDSGYGGAITAALFLKEFIPTEQKWAHFDFMAWNLSSRPGRPVGGEATCVRAVLEYLITRYS